MGQRRSFAKNLILFAVIVPAITLLYGCSGSLKPGAMISGPAADSIAGKFESPDTGPFRAVMLEMSGELPSFASQGAPIFSLEPADGLISPAKPLKWIEVASVVPAPDVPFVSGVAAPPSRSAYFGGSFAISVNDMKAPSVEIGTASIAGNRFTVTLNMLGVARSLIENKYPVITVREISGGTVIYRAIPGRIPKIYELPSGLKKLVIKNVRLDAVSTARAAVAFEKGPPDIAIAAMSGAEVRSDGSIVRELSSASQTAFDTAIDDSFGGIQNTMQLSVAANAIAISAISLKPPPGGSSDLSWPVPSSHESPSALAATFVRLLNDPRSSKLVSSAGPASMDFSFIGASGDSSFSISSFTPIASIPDLFKGIGRSGRVADPLISPPDMSTGVGSILVELSCSTPGASIVYTLDGSDPRDSASAATYSAPFTIKASATVTAAGVRQGMSSSNAVSARLTVVADTSKKLPPPSILPPSGTYTSETVGISFASAVPGVSYIYTLDGARPTKSFGLAYEGPFAISSSSLVRVISIMDGWADSPESSAAYEMKIPSPIFKPPPGIYTGSVEIEISCALPAAAIMYGSAEEGGEPPGYKVYSNERILIDSTTLIKAFAYGDGRTTSDPAEALYTIVGDASGK